MNRWGSACRQQRNAGPIGISALLEDAGLSMLKRKGDPSEFFIPTSQITNVDMDPKERLLLHICGLRACPTKLR